MIIYTSKTENNNYLVLLTLVIINIIPVKPGSNHVLRHYNTQSLLLDDRQKMSTGVATYLKPTWKASFHWYGLTKVITNKEDTS